MQEQTVAMGNTSAIVTRHDDGMQTFRMDAADTTPATINIVDSCGRQKLVEAHNSTMLIILPLGDIGAVCFDRHPDPTARDKDGNIVFLQRPPLSREEVMDMVSFSINKMMVDSANAPRVIVPPGGVIPNNLRSLPGGRK